jgi:Uma2 family endonuclease
VKMTRSAHHLFTFEDYLALEADSSVKHEYFAGQVRAMSGTSPAHARLAANVLRLLGARLDGKPCQAFTSDLRIRARATGLGTYPDVSVVCGRLELDPEDAKGHTVTNPRVLFEVSSPSTDAYDRGDKLAHYQSIPSVAEVVFVAQERCEVEVVRRESDGTWSRHVFGEQDALTLTSLDCELPVALIYRDPLA